MDHFSLDKNTHTVNVNDELASKLDFPRVAKFKARKQYRTDCVPKAANVGKLIEESSERSGT